MVVCTTQMPAAEIFTVEQLCKSRGDAGLLAACNRDDYEQYGPGHLL